MDLKNLDNIKIPQEEIAEMKDGIYGKGSIKESKFSKLKFVAAALVLVFISGFGFKSYTQDLPIYRNIFALFDMENYQDVGALINNEVTDKGISVRVVDAVYSNKSLSLTYIVKTDKNLGENINLSSDYSFKNIHLTGAVGSSSVKYMGENTYVGFEDLDLTYDGDGEENLKVNVTFNEIYIYDESYIVTDSIEGKWNFNFEVPQLEKERYSIGAMDSKEDIYSKLSYINIDDIGTELELVFWNTKGIPAYAYYSDSVYLEIEGEKVKLIGASGTANQSLGIFKYRFPSKLETGKEYTIFLNIVKETSSGFNEEGEVVLDDYINNEDFKKMPDFVEMKIPFTID